MVKDRWGFDEKLAFFKCKDVYLDFIEGLEDKFESVVGRGGKMPKWIEFMGMRLWMGEASGRFGELLKNLKAIYDGEDILDEEGNNILLSEWDEEDDEMDDDQKVAAAYGLY